MIGVCERLTQLGELWSNLEVTPELAAPQLLQVLSDLVEAPVTALCVFTGEGWRLHVHARVAQNSPVARLMADVRQLMEAHIGQPLATRADLALEEAAETVHHVAHRVVEPLVVPDRPKGYLLAGGEGPLSEETVSTVRLLASQAGFALTNGVLYRDLARERDRANLLLEATVAFNRAAAVADLRRVALDHLSRDLRMPQGIWLAGRDYAIQAVVGLLPGRAEGLKGQALSVACVPYLLDLGLGAEPVAMAVASIEDRRIWDAAIGFWPKLVVPVPQDHALEMAVLGDLARPGYRPSPDELTLARTMAGIAAGVLRRNALMEELKAARLDAIGALASAVDAKDHYTHSHSGNVSRLAEAIARHMGLPPDQRELVRLGGLLHDLGKIGIPEALLNKQSALDPAEYLRVQQHPIIGERIANAIQGMGEVGQIIRAHHERFDGTGYPDHLEGEQIPLAARIVTVADSFDAMTTDRPYRKGLPLEVALEQLQKGSGNQFDPQVVAALADLLVQRGKKAA